MDEADSLETFSNVLSEVAENPYDVNVHAQHIRVAQSLEGMESEVISAREMMTQFLAVGDDVWLPLLATKQSAVDLDTAEGVEELLALYARAENDYLCELLHSYGCILAEDWCSHPCTPSTSQFLGRKTRAVHIRGTIEA